MQAFSFVPPNLGPAEGQKNYVFVDEHNRHKRLKVMRACNGCRKRKIKCDAATTNTWPCSACTRLKLVCIPPTIGQDGDFSSHGQISEPSQQPPPMSVLHSADLNPSSQNISHQSLLIDRAHTQNMGSGRAYNDESRLYQAQPYIEHVQNPQDLYQHLAPSHLLPLQHNDTFQHNTDLYTASPPNTLLTTIDAPSYPKSEQSNAEDLSDALGDLKIDESGVAAYIRQPRKGERDPEVPTAEEGDAKLPPCISTSGATIRIPPELMPSDDEAMEYFDIYFTHIHFYVPVVHRGHLYQQWQSDKTSISPLLLEAIFACAGRMSDDPAQGAQWLALGNRHEAAFMEAPRLSTIQALLLLLKAREGSPKKGYFYRSWQTVKTMVSMAKDLDLHEHHSYHAEGLPCGLDTVECLVQTRVWQTLLVVETMIGGPQGRSDFGVDPDTVEYSTTLDIPNLDAFEIERSRLFAYFIRNVRSIRLITDSYHKLKKQPDWGANPRFIENNTLIPDWLASLPADLQVTYPQDGSPPWLPSHLIAITSPDPELNSDARIYFTRHMRLLEQCAAAWPVPDLQESINQLRLAFSADINKPFELKRSFPYGSPSDQHHPSPPMNSHCMSTSFAASCPEQNQLTYGTHALTPPISAEVNDKPDPILQELMHGHDQNQSLLNIPLADNSSWDPTRIINQWDLAFSGGGSNASSANSPPPSVTNPSHNGQSIPAQYHIQFSQTAKMPSIPALQPMVPPTYSNIQPVISARDWQRSVASVYDPHGLKRRWDHQLPLDHNRG
ncbi:C6 finger domain-containing protein [Histoplasma capsulatum var. duboisii H88]|uniref:C6 finger domain-containing protein n=1 Tax=Ajellomyces capsulatus (strain H88) TaxID=544711 RepID=F0UMQ2_AJEC8|nr:C6 finger domain-containing protein [Histoplasma capsulatum var. duboisii H88]